MRHVRRLAVALGLIGAVASAQAAVVVSFDSATENAVSYTLTGGFFNTQAGDSYDDPAGFWTITLDSPTPTGDPGSSDEWSLRLTLTRTGLGGSRIDYFGANSLSIGSGTAPWSINTFECAGLSGEFASASGGASCSLALDNSGDPPSWTVIGAQSLRVAQVPEPATLVLLALGAAGFAVSRRRRQ